MSFGPFDPNSFVSRIVESAQKLFDHSSSNFIDSFPKNQGYSVSADTRTSKEMDLERKGKREMRISSGDQQLISSGISEDGSPITTTISESPAQSTQIPWTVALLSGAMAGTTVDICLFPIDTLKTRMQASNGFWKAGGFKGIYSGVSAAFIGSAPGAALFFCSYEMAKPWIHSRIGSEGSDVASNPMAHMLAASIGEVSACLVRVPTEVVKQRMQTLQSEYRTLSDALNTIVSRYGLRGFYVGYGTTVFREIPFSFIQFPLWERLKLLTNDWFNDGRESGVDPYQGALCGSIAGGTAAGLTTPLDVVKTRLMLGTDANGEKYKGALDVIQKIQKHEGSKAFTRGLGPRVMWIFIGGFFFFGAYEKSKQVFGPLFTHVYSGEESTEDE